MAALGHCCCAWAFSNRGEQGLLPSCGAWASHSSGFSRCRAWALGGLAPGVAAQGLRS